LEKGLPLNQNHGVEYCKANRRVLQFEKPIQIPKGVGNDKGDELAMTGGGGSVI